MEILVLGLVSNAVVIYRGVVGASHVHLHVKNWPVKREPKLEMNKWNNHMF